MPAVKFTYQGGRTPRTFTEHMSKLRAAANKAADAAEFKVAVNKVGRIRKNRRELKQRIERMRNYVKRLPKNHIGKKLPKADLNKLISRHSLKPNRFNNFKRIIERGPRFVYPRSRLPNGKYTTNRANWTIAWWKAGHPQMKEEYNYYK